MRAPRKRPIAHANTMPATQELRLGQTRRWAVAYAIGFFAAYLYMNGRPTVFLYYQF